MRGFTLVEMIITVGIFIVITSLIFINYPQFIERVSLTRTSQEIALSLHQARTYALSVKQFTLDGVSYFAGYGIYFDISTPDSYILFADINENRKYDEYEKVEEFKIQTHCKFANLCINQKSSPPGNCVSKVNVVYQRPAPDVSIKGDASFASDAEIYIESPSGIQKLITVWSTGQVSVE